MSNVVHAEQGYFTRSRLYDSFKNLLAGLGVVDRDKATMQRFVLDLLDVEQLEAAYRGDWISRKVVDIPAFDSCREWRNWQAEQDQIEKIEEAERAFGLQLKLMQGIARARLYGGAAMIMGVKRQKFEEELNVDSVGKDDLAFVHVVPRWQIQPGPLVRDITSPWYGEPEYYLRSNSPVLGSMPGGVKSSSDLGFKPGDGMTIHPSRVVRLVGLEYPDMERAPDAWGDSSLQPVIDAIKNAGLVGGSIAGLTAKASVDIIKVKGLTQMLSTNKGTQALVERWSNANAAKSVINSLLVDMDGEDWQQLQVTFAGLPQVFQMYLAVAAGAADIPATRLLGRSPEGMNATGDSDMRNYYDRLKSDQEVRMTPTLSRLDEVLLRHVFGDRPKDIYYEWNPLWQLDEEQKSNVNLRKAQAHKIDVDAGLIAPDALRKGRENQLIEDGVYPGLEAALQEAEEMAEAEVPEEALHPHPAIHEKLTAREIAQSRFEEMQKSKIEAAKNGPKQLPFFGKKPNGNGAQKEKETETRDEMQQSLGFNVTYGGRKRRRRKDAGNT